MSGAHKSPLLAVVKLLALVVGWAGTQLSLMALAGPYLDNVWARFGAALAVAIVVPAVIADRLLPETDPKPTGLVSTVFAVTWLGAALLLVFATGAFGRASLTAEGERLEAEGFGLPAEVSFLLAGGRGEGADTKKEVAMVDPSATATGGELPEVSPPQPTAPPAPTSAPVVEPDPKPAPEEPKAEEKDEVPVRPRADDGDCPYPAGPYGLAKGDVLSPDIRWQGYAPGEDEASTFGLRDVFDCDGERGVDAIIIDTSQFG